MGSIVTLLVVLAIVAGGFWLVRQHQAGRTRELDDAKADARRWVERLGGQVLNLVGTNDAAKQALADAAERYTAAGSQLDQARTAAQARGVTETAYEGLYFARAARTVVGLRSTVSTTMVGATTVKLGESKRAGLAGEP